MDRRFITMMAAGFVLLAAMSVLSITDSPLASAQAGYSDGFDLGGNVDRPKHFTAVDLQAYPNFTMSAAFGAAQTFQTGRFTGVPLWDLLQEAGVQITLGRNNDKLRKYVVATGSDGYEALFSLAELDPEFGAEVVLIAYARDGEPLGPNEGMARLVIGTDKRGGRLVSNLTRLDVRDIDSPPRS